MIKNCIFTICAKNYLAQALTLRESVLSKEPTTDFFLFLSDAPSEEVNALDLELLDDAWIPGWKQMAFKYDVIEFSTAIKPFCFKKLFGQGYEKVGYLDPDTYVTSSLDYLWDNLEKYSIILTPHVSNLEMQFTGAVPEDDILHTGVFNLGFCFMRNNAVGQNIAEWWSIRLKDQCYSSGALFVDQKWMNFIPCFFPNDLLVCHHFGVNVAVWNLHERELMIEDGKYVIMEYQTGKVFPLLIFHFSGFDPFNNQLINRRHPQFGVDHFPSFAPIIEEYRALEYKNGYDKYSKLHYSFNEFEDGSVITRLQRRIFRTKIEQYRDENPFSVHSSYYQDVKRSKLLAKGTQSDFSKKGMQVAPSQKRKVAILFERGARLLKSLVGVKRYISFLSFAQRFVQWENQDFLLGNRKAK